MWRKVIIRFMAVLALSAISIVAYASSFSGKGCRKSDIQTYIEKIEVPSEAAVTPEETSVPEISTPELTPESTAEPAEQNLIMSMDWNKEERYLLAKIAMAEAESEDTKGKALVMLVVLNRVRSEEFPGTIGEVIYQPRQFSPISNGRFDRVEPDEDCWRALDLIMLDKWDKSHGATYFESKSESTWHSEHLDFLFRHGRHYFYKDREE